MEEFFKDIFFDFQTAPESARTRTAYTELVTIYARLLAETTNWLGEDGRDGAPVGRLIASASDAADHLTIITFNHDLVIENEIFRRARLRSRWCLERGYGSMGDELLRLFSADEHGVPRVEAEGEFPHHGPECNHVETIDILKLHGSLNWFIKIAGRQPTAGVLTGKTGRKEVLLIPARDIRDNVTFELPPPAARGRRSWYTWPVIVPPVYAKQALIGPVQTAWDDAGVALAACDRLVFFGYSLPELDIESEKLFQRGITKNKALKWIDVINPAPYSAQRYAGLVPNRAVRWYPTPELFTEINGF
jgi:hypothetical protein